MGLLKEIYMLVSELILRKKNLKLQIDELKKFLLTEEASGNINKTTNTTFELEDKLQQYIVALSISNNETMIQVGKSKINIATAVMLKNTTQKKINVLTELIENNINIDIFNLMEQRNIFFEEHMLLDKTIKESDWKVELE
jgi:hypothetical protein